MIMKKIREHVRGQKGQGIVEYALILAFVVGLAVYLTDTAGLGTAIKNVFSGAATQINNSNTSGGSNQGGGNQGGN